MKWLFPFVAATALISQRASADTTVGYAIARVPIVLTVPGVYHLTKDLIYAPAAGAAIEIGAGASGTVIDLNGYQLICTAGAANLSTGIFCDGPNRVTVRNGQVLGFANGVFLVSGDATVKDMLVTPSYKAGITVIGNSAEIQHNRVIATGGSAVASSTTSIGITLSGTYGNVSDNDVHDTFISDAPGHSAIGILIKDSGNVVTSNNRVLDVEPAIPNNGGSSTGISTQSSTSLFFLDNIVSTDELGFDLSGASSGDYGDNTTNAPAASYSGASSIVNIGNNN
jgi:hypothetical protein